MDQAPPSSPAQGATGAQQGLESPRKGAGAPSLSLAGGVPAADPRVPGLCSHSSPGGLGLGATEQRALYQPRQAGDLLLHRLHPLPAVGKGEGLDEDPQAPPGLTHAHPPGPCKSHERLREVAVLLSPATSTPFIPSLSLPPATPSCSPQPCTIWCFVTHPGTSATVAMGQSLPLLFLYLPSSKAPIHGGVSPAPLLTWFPYPWLVQGSQTLRGGDRQGQGTAPEGQRSWGCAAC